MIMFLRHPYQDFFGTQPPLFHQTDEPLDADAWLRTIESKFALLPVPCSEANKTLFAAQQLRGTARIWWDNYRAMLPADHVVTWEEFRTAFRAHHIPKGLLERKLNEFLALTQGNRTVLQYAPSITCASMLVIMLIAMPRSRNVSTVVLAPSSRSVSTLSAPTVLMS